MSIVGPQVERQLRDRFASSLEDAVVLTLHVRSQASSRLVLMSGGVAAGTSNEVREIAQAVADASNGKVRLDVVEVPLGEHDDDLPRLTIGVDGETPRIEFRGLPSGYEFATLVDAVERVSSGKHLTDENAAKLAGLDKDVEVMVFVTPTCQYCPSAASTANRMALASDRIRAVTVEANEFPVLASRFGVQGVPLTVVNAAGSFVGAMPEAAFVERVLELAGANAEPAPEG
jgi:glutaredoxin-like protein